MAILNNKNLMLVGLKGATGSKIVSTELIGQDEHGGNIYKQTFDDGSTAEFVAPRGADGSGADIEIDRELSLESENPVQNKVIAQEFGAVNEELNKKLDAKEDVGFGLSGGTYAIYSVNSNKEQTFVKADPWGYTANTLAMRGGSGTVKVAPPTQAYDATPRSYVDTIKGDGAPTTEIKASYVGHLYIDTTNNTTYQCTAIDNGVYTWVKLIRETDLAQTNQAGLLLVSNLDYGLEIVPSNNNLGIRAPSDWNIVYGRKNSGRSPVTLSKVDKVVKQVLIDPLETMSPEEQAKAQAWLGIEKWEDFNFNFDTQKQISQSLITVKKVKIKAMSIFVLNDNYAEDYTVLSDCDITLSHIDNIHYAQLLLMKDSTGEILRKYIKVSYHQEKEEVVGYNGTLVGITIDGFENSNVTISVLTGI